MAMTKEYYVENVQRLKLNELRTIPWSVLNSMNTEEMRMITQQMAFHVNRELARFKKAGYDITDESTRQYLPPTLKMFREPLTTKGKTANELRAEFNKGIVFSNPENKLNTVKKLNQFIGDFSKSTGLDFDMKKDSKNIGKFFDTLHMLKEENPIFYRNLGDNKNKFMYLAKKRGRKDADVMKTMQKIREDITEDYERRAEESNKYISDVLELGDIDDEDIPF